MNRSSLLVIRMKIDQRRQIINAHHKKKRLSNLAYGQSLIHSIDRVFMNLTLKTSTFKPRQSEVQLFLPPARVVRVPPAPVPDAGMCYIKRTKA